MSYSFTVRAVTRKSAKGQVALALEKVVQQQPVHAVDFAHAQAVASTFIDLLPEVADKQELVVVVSGSVSWSGAEQSPTLSSANVGVSAYLQNIQALPKPPTPTPTPTLPPKAPMPISV